MSDLWDELVVSVDIETTGPRAGKHSMVSLGAVAFMPDGRECADFSVNLKELQPISESRDERTMKEFWGEHPGAWVAAAANLVDPIGAMHDFDRWLCGLPTPQVLLAYPVSFDVPFIQWYMGYFCPGARRLPGGLDFRSFAAGYLRTGGLYRGTSKRSLPVGVRTKKGEHTHVAVDDAREQGQAFFRLLQHGRM